MTSCDRALGGSDGKPSPVTPRNRCSHGRQAGQAVWSHDLQSEVMQSPIILFDHVRKTLVSIPTGPAADRRLAELVAKQSKQVATSGRPK
jgi:hypothetical protein